jgi:hypothetical protein
MLIRGNQFTLKHLGDGNTEHSRFVLRRGLLYPSLDSSHPWICSSSLATKACQLGSLFSLRLTHGSVNDITRLCFVDSEAECDRCANATDGA